MTKKANTMKDYYVFPKNFLWGAATAAYQIEGAAAEDGRGPSVWDTFCAKPGKVLQDHTGDVATDHYHRYREDVGIMADLGLKAYRMSLSWSRLLPTGAGTVNARGVDFYDRLFDELLAHGIEPWVTLYHWDMPQALEDEFGGWESREVVKRFGDYAALVAQRFSDRVHHFMTLNEMWVIADCCYTWGINPPQKTLPAKGANQVRHHVILAHGVAAEALRAHARQPLQVGLAQNLGALVPVVETPENVAAARKALRYEERGYLTPIMEGKYLDSYLQEMGADAPTIEEGDMKTIGAPLDFLGMNLYGPTYVRAAPQSPLGYVKLPTPKAYPHMHVDWINVGPQIVYWTPRLAHELWNVPAIYITENGCGCDDRLTTDGEVLDTDRVMYLRNHFIAAHRAVQEGVPLKGYFVWSLLDNFEWKEGYTQRFGLVYVNYQTLKRTPKLSAEFYREVIARNAVV